MRWASPPLSSLCIFFLGHCPQNGHQPMQADVSTLDTQEMNTNAQRRQRKAQTPQLALAESVQRSCVYAGGAAGGYARITENVEQSRQ